MSAQEIIEELPKLGPAELRLVAEKLRQLESGQALAAQSGWGKALVAIIGKADDLPSDLALHHDHYLYGTPKTR
jgi:hypothetical protein